MANFQKIDIFGSQVTPIIKIQKNKNSHFSYEFFNKRLKIKTDFHFLDLHNQSWSHINWIDNSSTKTYVTALSQVFYRNASFFATKNQFDRFHPLRELCRSSNQISVCNFGSGFVENVPSNRFETISSKSYWILHFVTFLLRNITNSLSASNRFYFLVKCYDIFYC